MMDVLQYLVNGVVWSVFGFAAGYYVCTVQREVHAIKESVVDHEPDHLPSPHAHAHVASHRHAGEAYERARRRFGWLVVLLALVVVVQGTLTSVSYRTQGECQNGVNRALREDALVRAARSAEDWATLKTLLTAVEAAGDNEAEKDRALEEANDALAASKPATGQAYIADEC